MDREKILLDTDIGSDIDDAVCLAYLLVQPACQLMGVTTVSGEPDKRSQMASALLRAAGVDAPVISGVSDPVIGKNNQPLCPQHQALARWPHDTAFPDISALEFMRTTIRRHPGEITLLAIGPMTNAGLLFAADPQCARLLKRLVLMCGDFGRVSGAGVAEWNARADPLATSLVYRAAAPVHRSIGLNVTTKVVLPAAQVRALFAQHPLLQPVLDFAEVWFQRAPHITFHDPLAAATVFDEGICAFQRGTVEPEIHSPRAAGATWFQPAPEGGVSAPHEVAMDVSAARFFAHYFGAFGLSCPA